MASLPHLDSLMGRISKLPSAICLVHHPKSPLACHPDSDLFLVAPLVSSLFGLCQYSTDFMNLFFKVN
jgi:hypothetical protein